MGTTDGVKDDVHALAREAVSFFHEVLMLVINWDLAEARHAHELLGKGGVTGKIVLVRNASSLESGAA